MIRIWYGDIVLPDKLLRNGQIIAEDGIIIYVGERKDNFNGRVKEIFHYENSYIWPGLIDIHIHGAGGYDTVDDNKSAVTGIAKELIKYGVTGFLATTITLPFSNLEKVINRIGEFKWNSGEAELLGIHLEGPWINEKYKGAHNIDHIQIPDRGQGIHLNALSNGKMKLVTLAPEIHNSLEMVEELAQLGIAVSLGHSDATYETIKEATILGAKSITHIYNAMRGFHHREIGVVGSALLIDQLYCEVIADGHHVHPLAVKTLAKNKNSDKIILISDGIRSIGKPDGEYDLGGLLFHVKDGQPRLPDGTLAGSTLTLNKAIMNIMEFADLPIWEAVKMASLNPATLLGFEQELGSIEVGKRSNLVSVDKNGDVKQVWIDGRVQIQ